jgi:hypothetical protein
MLQFDVLAEAMERDTGLSTERTELRHKNR